MARSSSFSQSPRRRRSHREEGDTRHEGEHSRGNMYHRSGHQDRSSHRHRDRSSHRHRSRSPHQTRRHESIRRRSPAEERSPKRRRTEDTRGDRKEKSLQNPEVGSVLRATVRSVKAFGCFVELESFGRDGLVHHSHISPDLSFEREDEDADRVAAMEYFCPLGSQVWVKIVEVRQGNDGDRINCSMSAVDQDSGKDLDPTGSQQEAQGGRGRGRSARGPLNLEPPEKGSVHKAKILSIRPFGAFVQIEGYKANGLVHVSQISDHLGFEREDSDDAKVAALKEILSVDETVYVKVVEVRDAEPGSDRGPKIGCSIKLVSQKDGTDWDPNGLKFQPRQEGEGGRVGRAPVGANAGQIQQGNIDWGYLNADKVNMDPRNADFEMLESDEEKGARDADGQEILPGPPKKGLKKQQKLQNQDSHIGAGDKHSKGSKKEKKKHKQKDKKHKQKDKSKKKKKHKKEHKERKYSNSSSSSD